jgi:hypothetical protein
MSIAPISPNVHYAQQRFVSQLWVFSSCEAVGVGVIVSIVSKMCGGRLFNATVRWITVSSSAISWLLNFDVMNYPPLLWRE